MEPTTPSSDGGVAEATVPQESTEAVSLGEQGAPVLRPKIAPTSTPQSQQQSEELEAPADPNPAQAQPEQTQQSEQSEAPAGDDLEVWAEKQGIDLDNPTPEQIRQVSKRLRDTQQKMHEATARSRELELTMAQEPNLEYTGNPEYDTLAREVNTIKIQNRVADFFSAVPEAREYESEMAKIVKQRPYLQGDLEALYALAVNSPDRAAQFKKEGGRDALANLAQKQSAVPPQSNASTGVSSSKEKITSDNVDSVVAAHMGDAKWYSAHKSEIDRAMAGTR